MLEYIPSNPRTPVMNMVIKMKLAKNPEQANKVLIVTSIVAVILTFALAKSFIFPRFTSALPEHTIFIQ